MFKNKDQLKAHSSHYTRIVVKWSIENLQKRAKVTKSCKISVNNDSRCEQ